MARKIADLDKLAEAQEAADAALFATIMNYLGVKKLNANQARGLARLTGKDITIGRTTYHPTTVEEEERKRVEGRRRSKGDYPLSIS